MPLDPARARAVYDRIGRLQDTQAFYEEPATEQLIAASEFAHARRVFELGCGTGRLAATLLRDHLPADATYLGVDVSPRMVATASQRLRPWAGRARIELTNGRPPFGARADTFDRFVATYVLDLLPDEILTATLADAHRLLAPGGRLCLTSITPGTRPLPRAVSTAWAAIAAHAPALTGGCRPLQLDHILPASAWRIVTDQRLTAWTVSSQVLVAQPR